MPRPCPRRAVNPTPTWIPSPPPRLRTQYGPCGAGSGPRPPPFTPGPPAPRPSRRAALGCSARLAPACSRLAPASRARASGSHRQSAGPPVRAPGDGQACPGRRAPCPPPPAPRQARRSYAGCRPTPRARASAARTALRVRSLAPCVSAATRCRAPSRSPADWGAAESAPCRDRHPAREAGTTCISPLTA